MQIEHGKIQEFPGLEESYTIIPDTMRMNPKCPCLTRTCPNHGFCQYCIHHHDMIDRLRAEHGVGPEGVFCKREECKHEAK